MLREDTEDEEQPVSGIRYDEIRQDGMCMAAGADKTEDAELMAHWFSTDKINNGASVIGVDMAGTPGRAAGTGPQFRAEPSHKGIKKRF